MCPRFPLGEHPARILALNEFPPEAHEMWPADGLSGYSIFRSEREQEMHRRTSKVLAILATAVISSMMVRVAGTAQTPGQQDAQGAPQSGKGTGPTVPVKLTTRDYDKKILLSAPALPESALRGRALWVQRCAYCHDGLGTPSYKTMGQWLGAETVQQLGEDKVRVFISAGSPRMPSFKYDLDSQQVDDLITFLKTVPSSQKPTESQLEGKASGPDSND